MRKMLVPCLILLALLVAGVALMSRADLAPASMSNTLARTAQDSTLVGYYFEGSTLLLTNWQCFSDADSLVTQDLTGIEVALRVGVTSTNVPYTGNVYNAQTGYFGATITVPSITTAPSVSVQVTLTDTNSLVTFVYPLYYLLRREILD